MLTSKKPFTAITQKIKQLTSEGCVQDVDSGLPELVDILGLPKKSGLEEAAEAIRKQLKDGNSVHRQLRALALLDGLISNVGPEAQKVMANHQPLIKQLKYCGNHSSPDVKKKCSALFTRWHAQHKDSPGLEAIADLRVSDGFSRQNQRHVTQKTAVGQINPFRGENPEEDLEPTEEDLKKRTLVREKRITDLEDRVKKHKPSKHEAGVAAIIGMSTSAANCLTETLETPNRIGGAEEQMSSDDRHAARLYRACGALKQIIQRYITRGVSNPQLLDNLLKANDQLFEASKLFEVHYLPEADSDDDVAALTHQERMAKFTPKEPSSPEPSPSPSPPVSGIQSLSVDASSPPPKPPRPSGAPPRPSALSKPAFPPPQPNHNTYRLSEPSDEEDDSDADADEDEDENDPFADRNAVVT